MAEYFWERDVVGQSPLKINIFLPVKTKMFMILDLHVVGFEIWLPIRLDGSSSRKTWLTNFDEVIIPTMIKTISKQINPYICYCGRLLYDEALQYLTSSQSNHVYIYH